jgi:hypothetical protein
MPPVNQPLSKRVTPLTSASPLTHASPITRVSPITGHGATAGLSISGFMRNCIEHSAAMAGAGNSVQVEQRYGACLSGLAVILILARAPFAHN